MADIATEDNIAENLADSQKSISISEFFEQNKHMLGFDSGARAIVTAVKEGVDNALDATEEAGILPEIDVIISKEDNYYKIILEDNGPGIPEDNIPKVFGKLLYGSRFHKREQNRGQQGIGISAAVLYSQLTSGEPAKILSKTENQDKANYYELIIDTETNNPEIKKKEKQETEKEHGTRIELKMEANMRGRKTLHKYLKNTAVVNPHAKIRVKEPKNEINYKRVSEQLPQKTEEIKPHPHGADLGTLIRMIEETEHYKVNSFLKQEFSKVGQKTSQSIINNFKDYEYGRQLNIKTEYIRNNIEKGVRNGVSRKKEEEVSKFSDKIKDKISNEEYLNYELLKEIIQKSSDEIEDEFDTRFGDTVRNNTLESVWEDINGVYSTVKDIVVESTSKRKTIEVVELISYSITMELSKKEKLQVRKDDIRSLVDIACNNVVSSGDYTIGDTAREKITNSLWENMSVIDEEIPKIKKFRSDRDLARSLLKGMNDAKVSRPSNKCLSPITPDQIKKGLEKEYDADFYTSSKRDGGVYKGSPVIVEAGLAYGGQIEEQNKIQLQRYANRVPLVYQKGACSITNTVEDIGWRNYNLKQSGGHGIPKGPVVLVVHVASTNVPFTSESKDAIANVPEIEKIIERAVRDVGRDLKNHINKQNKISKRKEKQNVITEILPEMANKLSEISSKDSPDVSESLSKIMNSVLIETKEDKIIIQNNSNSKEELELRDDNEVLWSGEIKSGEDVTLDKDKDDFEVEGLEEPNYTIKSD